MSFRLPAGQSLQDIDRAGRRNWIAQPGAVAERLAVDDNRHVSAQRRLIVEDVSAQALVAAKDVVEGLAHGRPLRLGLRAIDVPLQIDGEKDSSHAVELAPVTA
jgi:hypothetical protein